MFSENASANPLLESRPRDSLTFRKGDGVAGLSNSFRRSSEFFVGSHKQDTDVSGNPHQYDDWVLTVEAAYGLTDRWSLWLSIPFVYRNESRLYNASDHGMGDAAAGMRYVLWRSQKESSEIAFDLSGKFPSGDTDVSAADADPGKIAELPVGGGYSELEPAFALRHRFARFLSADLYAGYAFRFSALVEYLATPTFPFAASDGTIYYLPLGNLKIDWGDQVTLRGKFVVEPAAHWFLEAGIAYLYRRPTLVRSFVLTQVESAITSERQDLEADASQLLTVSPALSAEFAKNWKVRASAEIPVLGDNYPILPIAESAVGNTYRLEVRHGF